MSRLRGLALLCAICLLLTGCDALSPEKQAYVVCMALDYGDDGRVRLCAQIPESSENAGGKGRNMGAPGYAIMDVSADTLDDALTLMEAGVPYPLNFSQLRLCVLGGEFAAAADLRALTRALLLRPDMRPMATLAVAVGKGEDVIRAQLPEFGMRLSKHIDVTLRTLQGEGLVPDSRLAACARDFARERGDPLLMLCAANPALGEESDAGGGQSAGGGQGDSSGGAQASFALLDPQDSAGTLPRTGNNPVEFLGAAITTRGRVSGQLSGREMQLFTRLCAHATLRVALASDSVQLQALLPDSLLPEQVEYDALLSKLQALQSDALGFSAIAATFFATESAHDAADFPARYPSAERYVGGR